PGSSIAGHFDLPGRPCQPSQVVQDDVKPHSRRSAIGSGIAHEGRGESLCGQLFHVTLNQGLAYCVSGLGTNPRLLSYVVAFRDAIYAEGRHVNEALYSRLTGKFSEINRTLVVDFVSNVRRQLSRRVIRQFSHVNNGLNVL